MQNYKQDRILFPAEDLSRIEDSLNQRKSLQ